MAATGIAPLEINTAYQVYADLQEDPGLHDQVGLLLPLPDLLAYSLGAPASVGRAIASTMDGDHSRAPGAAIWVVLAMARPTDAGAPRL